MTVSRKLTCDVYAWQSTIEFEREGRKYRVRYGYEEPDLQLGKLKAIVQGTARVTLDGRGRSTATVELEQVSPAPSAEDRAKAEGMANCLADRMAGESHTFEPLHESELQAMFDKARL